MVLMTSSTTDTVAAATSTGESKRRLASTSPSPTTELRSNRNAVLKGREIRGEASGESTGWRSEEEEGWGFRGINTS